MGRVGELTPSARPGWNHPETYRSQGRPPATQRQRLNDALTENLLWMYLVLTKEEGMKKGIIKVLTILAPLLLMFNNGCSVYSGVSKSGTTVYLTGYTHFLMFASHWVKRCVEGPTELSCTELDVNSSRAPVPVASPNTPRDTNTTYRPSNRRDTSRRPETVVTGVGPETNRLKGRDPRAIESKLTQEMQRKLSKKLKMLRMCRNNYNKKLRKLVLKAVITPDGTIKTLSSEKMTEGSNFHNCISRVLKFTQLSEHQLQKVTIKNQVTF